MNERARAALGGGRSDTAVIAASALVGLVAGVGAVFARYGGRLPPRLDGIDFAIGFGVLVVTVGVAAGVLAVVVAPLRTSREMARLVALPFAFDLDAYYEFLGQDYTSTSTVDVDVWFASPDAPRVVAEALTASPHVLELRWRDDRLHFESPEIATELRQTSNGVDTRTPMNDGLHRWFASRAVPLLVALHARSPIASVTVKRSP